MNKIFFGIHTSLLLLLCALLACCSQDEEEYAPTEKLVPLDISAVIEGATRVSLDGNGAGSFGNGDKITLAIDGDESGKSYVYVYDEENGKWNPEDNDLLISSDATEVKIKAEYGAPDYSSLPLGLDALANNLGAEATVVDFPNPKAQFTFSHKACKLNMAFKNTNVSMEDITGCDIYVYDSEICNYMYVLYKYENSWNFYYYHVLCNSPTTIYTSPTADEVRIAITMSTGIKTYTFSPKNNNLQAGKTYTCYINLTL